MPAITAERSIIINAPRGQVYATVRDFRQWPAWSPWVILEPEARLTFSNDGRRYDWAGDVVGAGNIKVVDEQEGVFIDYELTFLKPFKSTARVRMAFANAVDATKVTWRMDSSLPFFLFFMVKTMNAMIGMDYERGLQMLKRFIETGSRQCQLEILGRESFSGFSYLGLRVQCAISDVGPSMETHFAELTRKFDEAGLKPSGAPFSIYHKWDMGKGRVDYTLGFPVEGVNGNAPAGVLAASLPDIEVYTIKHTGAYQLLGNAWSAGMCRQRARQFRCGKLPPFEVYHNDPRETKEDDLITTVHLPLK